MFHLGCLQGYGGACLSRLERERVGPLYYCCISI